MKLQRAEANPILEPRSDCRWEQAGVSNPGVWSDSQSFLMLYRGESDTESHPTTLGLAEGTKNLEMTHRSTKPVFGPSNDGFDGGLVENARIVKYGDIYYVTYATRMFTHGDGGGKIIPFPPEQATPSSIRGNFMRGALAATRDFQAWFRLGPITPSSVDDQDVILFPTEIGDYCFLLHRPTTWVGPEYGCEKPSIWLSQGLDLMSWKNDTVLAQPEFDWEAQAIGGGAPPIRTDEGWLFIYYGVDEQDVYRVGAMLLDIHDPSRVIGRTREPLLEPATSYETEGLIPNKIYPSGAANLGGTLNVFYGAAQSSIGLATAPMTELVQHLLDQPVS